jgi:ABC-2 type transport system ATP-binding protein
MRQRLGLAGALLRRPELLVLDEPTNGLDPQGMREVRLLLRRLADQGTTVFVSSHLLAEVEAMCDRVGVLSHGRLVAEGPPSRLRAASARLRVEVDDRERARKVLADLAGVGEDDAGEPPPGAPERPAAQGPPEPQGPGALRVRLAPPATAAAVNAALVGAGVAVSALVSEHERLEDVFIELTGEGLGGDVPG